MSSPSSATAVPRRILLLGLWLAILTGFLEVAWLGINSRLIGKQVRVGPHVLWMAPTAHLLVFGTLAIVFAALARRWPARPWFRDAAFVFIALGAFSFLLNFPQLHRMADLALALGIAVRLSGPIVAHADGLSRIVRRTVAPLAALVAFFAVGVPARAWWLERRALAALPAAAADAPNVLLLILDTVRAQSLSLYGYERATTPNLERIAKRGAVFDWAISAAPWTLPSHASMFTGHYSQDLSTDWYEPLDETFPTLAERMAAHGYRTGGFVANTYYCGWELGLGRGFSRYEDFNVLHDEFVVSTGLGRMLATSDRIRKVVEHYDDFGRKPASRVSGDFLRWLDEGQKGSSRPFFAFLNLYDAHDPYLPPAPFDTKFGPRRSPPGMPATSTQGLKDMYEGAIAYLDTQVGALIDSLDARGTLRNTIVVITADHGEAIGELGIFGHGKSLHTQEVRVPLLVIAPGRVPEGRRVQRAVSLRDLGATVHTLAGVEQGPFPGESFAAVMRDSTRDRAWADTVYTEFDEKQIRSLIAGPTQYILYPNGREEVFDLSTDPTQAHNLARASASGIELAKAMRRALDARVAAMGTRH